MTDFKYWQGVARSHGQVLCVICCASKPEDEMYRDDDGDLWDYCLDCAANGGEGV